MAAVTKKKKPGSANRSVAQSQRRREENIFTVRMLSVFGAIILSVVALLQFKGVYAQKPYVVDKVLVLVGAPLFVAGIFLGGYYLIRTGLERRTPHAVAASGIAALAIGGACLLIKAGGQGVLSAMYVMLPAAAVLYLIFYLYQREFFFLALLVSGEAAGLWALSRLMGDYTPAIPEWAAFFSFGAALILAVIALWLLRLSEGVLSIGKARWRILSHGAKYRFLFIACGICAALVAAAFIWGWQAAWYGMFVMFGYLFVTAVYYTVKSM